MDMKKRFVLLSLLATLSLSGCDSFSNIFNIKSKDNNSSTQNNEEKSSEQSSLVTFTQEDDETIEEDTTQTTTINVSGDDTDLINAYYQNINITSADSGSTLKVKLYNLIKGHTKYDYGSLEVAMKVTDRDYELDPITSNESDNYDPYMKLLYADYNGDKSTAKKWSTSQGSFGTETNYVWNKEHIWAKSNGFKNASGCEAYSDLHHLRASDWKCNNRRSNNPFGVISNHSTSNASEDYTQSRKTDNYYTSTLFEPRDADKGDVARALFYMATRYYNGDGSDGSNLTLTTGTDSSGGKWGYLNTLLQWHVQDPPDAFEIHRNSLVQSFQKNRNPYIDHPEWAQKVFG